MSSSGDDLVLVKKRKLGFIKSNTDNKETDSAEVCDNELCIDVSKHINILEYCRSSTFFQLFFTNEIIIQFDIFFKISNKIKKGLNIRFRIPGNPLAENMQHANEHCSFFQTLKINRQKNII